MDAVREERIESGNACASIEKEVGETLQAKELTRMREEWGISNK